MKKLLFISSFVLSMSSFAVTHTINVVCCSFSPNSLTVNVGDEIQWVWGNGTHTTTSISVPTGAATWDSPITSSNSTFTYTVTEEGTYDYKCTPHFGSGMTGTFTATVATGTSKPVDVSNVFFYPNPVIEVGYIQGGVDSYQLFDVSGNEKATGNGKAVDFSDLESGCYLLQINKEGEQPKTVKVVKK